MAKKKVNLKEQKARKQKMILIVGGVLLVVVLVIQAPRILKMVHGGGGGPTTAQYKAFPDQARPAEAAAAVSISSSGTMELPDRDPQPEPGDGQLLDFALFPSKDPFVPQVKLPENGQSQDSPPSDKPAPDEPAGGGTAQNNSGEGGAQVEAAVSTSATISVNGAEETVDVGGQFPAADPAFVLVSATSSSVRIGIAGGSLASGDQTVTLRRGNTLTLVNTVDGTEYHLKLVAPS
jgi:hypothetical protein